MSLALGAEATFVARTIDTDRKHLTEVLTAAHEHQGASLRRDLPELRRCSTTTRSTAITDRDTKVINQIPLRQGEPIVFGPDGEHAVVAEQDGSMSIMSTAEAGDRVVVHDAHRDEPTTAFALSRLALSPTGPTPLGIFRDVERPVYDDMLNEQVDQASAERGDGDLQALLESGNVWDVTGAV